MKAMPCRIIDFTYIGCEAGEATHLKMKSYGHFPNVVIPINKVKGYGGPCWDWNGDQENPTVRPSIRTSCSYPDSERICHCFITNGMVQFLDDSTHEFAGQTLPLNDI
jgi:hypothetical protein